MTKATSGIRSAVYLITCLMLLPRCGLFSPDDTGPGSVIWNTELDCFANRCPAIGSDGTIYVSSSSLFALNPEGQIIWTYKSEHGWIFGHPVVTTDGTILIHDSRDWLCAVNPDGSEKWTLDGVAYFSPAVGDDGTIYVGGPDDILYAITPEGEILWECALPSLPAYSAPVISPDGTIYIATGYSLNAVSAAGTSKWQFSTEDRIMASPAIGEYGEIYLTSNDGLLYCLSPDGELDWWFPLGNRGTSESAVIGPMGDIYVGSHLGRFYALSSEGSMFWSYQTEGIINSAAVIGADSTIYVTSKVPDGNTTLYAFRFDGSIAWRKRGDWKFTPTLGNDGTLYLLAHDHRLWALRSDSPGLIDSAWPKYQGNLRNTGVNFH